MSEKLDIVLFGATGFTGKHAIPYIEKFSKTKTKTLTWGIAGRSEEKLKSTLNDCKKQTGISSDDVPLIIADVENEQSIKNMVRRARIIINCCGPFRFYGEPVVKACVEEGVHYVDVSGEIQFIEKMQLKYHKKAEEKGVYIISACGLESIPADLGIVFMQQNFTGTLNSVEVFLRIWEDSYQSSSGSAINYGTWESAIHTLGNKGEIRDIRKQLFPNRLPIFKPKLKLKKLPHQPGVVKGWAFPFHGTDLPVVKRSQRLFYEKKSKRPVQIETYFNVRSIILSIFFCIGTFLSPFVCAFTWAQKLLLKYPEWFTFGMIKRGTPSIERIENAHFNMTLYGEGWKETLPDANDQFVTRPNRAMALEISGRNPGYGFTNLCLVLAAVTVITETDKMPPEGGVYPPGYAFANTSLMKRLKESDAKIDILYEKDL